MAESRTDAAYGVGWTLGGFFVPGSPLTPEFVPRLLRYGDDPEAVSAPTEIEELVIVSLFSDARAETDDDLLASTDGRLDRRGWWAERLGADPHDRFGSRLWLLSRAKETPETRLLARDYAEEALRWLVEDGLAERVDVDLVDVETPRVGLRVRVYRGDGRTVEFRYPRIWEGVSGG